MEAEQAYFHALMPSARKTHMYVRHRPGVVEMAMYRLCTGVGGREKTT